ncbi:MAG: sulfatase [Thermoanaerobaculia bacterium]
MNRAAASLRSFLAFALALGCAPAPERSLPAGRVPLAALAGAARLAVETRVVDVGEPEARAALGTGWGPDERSPETSFAWGGGASSTVTVEIVEPRDLELVLRGWSFPFPSGPPQRVRLRWNGEELGRRELAREPREIALAVDRERVRSGENLLELAYERFDETADASPWAAAWDYFRLAEGTPPAPPTIDGAASSVTLPAGTAVEWTLELPPDSWLVWSALTSAGGARAAAGREREGEGTAERAISGAGRLELVEADAARPQLVRFALSSAGRAGAVRLGGVELRTGGARPPSATPVAGAASANAGAAPRRPNLVVYLIDTLRADHLGCYGYPRPTSPEIDRFARSAVLFREGRAQASWTRPAVATILTGLYPITHAAEQKYQRIPEAVETLAERLTAAGYESALFTTNANLAPRFGFDQGWATYQYLSKPGPRVRQHLSSAEMNEHVLDWLGHRDSGKPFFLVVHTMDPHDPYLPEVSFRERLAPGVDAKRDCCLGGKKLAGLPEAELVRHRDAAMALYDAEIAENDASFGTLLADLERRGLSASTAVLLLADHGEEFLDHGGWKHGWTLYEEMLRIPFVLRLPGGAEAGRAVDSPVDQVDVAPTLLELAGLPLPPELPGRSALGALAGETPQHASLAWLERPNLAWRSAARAGWKLIRFDGAWLPPLGRPAAELFALGTDPAERTNLARERPLRRLWLDGELRTALRRYLATGASESTTVDPELERTLRALGYI